MPLDGLTESPILSLIHRIFEMRRTGQEVLGLHIGEPDFETPLGIRKAAWDAMNAGETHYVSAQGIPELREAIARYLARHDHVPATAADVIVLPAKFAIYATLLATVSPGDEVVLPNPTYLFEQPIQLVGGKPVFVPLRPDFHLDLDAIEKSLSPRTRAVMLVSPGNPTGQVLSPEELAPLLEWARERHFYVVSDETYEALVYSGTHTAPASLPGGRERVITIGSFSKMFAMTGWRAGFAIAPPPILARLVKVMEHTLTCVPSFIQRACLWGLEHAEPDVVRFRETFARRRERTLSLLAKVPGLSVVPPPGAFYVFPSYEAPLPSLEFCRRLLEEEKLALVPGIAFGPQGERHLRISYSSPEPALEEGIRRLGSFLGRVGPG